MPEILRPDVTGFVGATLDDLVRGIRAIDRLDRATCRAEFEKRFAVERMADDYEEVYRRILASASASSLSQETVLAG